MDATRRPSQELINAQKELARRRQMAGVSAPVDREPQAVDSGQWAAGSGQVAPPLPRPSAPPLPRSFRLSPTLAAFCLDRDHGHNGALLDGPYRLYKILQALDGSGRGWLANSRVELLLTRKESAFFIYGRRQLKIMLRRGEGLFWNRVKHGGQVRIRLVARAKVTAALGAGRLRGREVELPLTYLLGSGRGRQAQVNAALYAGVHAGRLRPDRGRAGHLTPRPISRAALRDLSGCSRYRQRSYERRMKIRVRANIHILSAYTKYGLQRARQYLGLPAYKHVDHLGKVNRHQAGAAYLAVRLPNSYHLPQGITTVQSRRQRTINRLLDGLCPMGSGGSGEEKVARRYFRDVAAAMRAGRGNNEGPAYWPLTDRGETRLWEDVTRRNRGGDLY